MTLSRVWMKSLVLAATGVLVAGSGALASDRCGEDLGKVSYFRRLAEVNSWAEPIVGVGELTKTHAQKIAHFRIEVDGCGAVIDAQYFHGDVPKPIDENFSSNRLTPTSHLKIKREANKAFYHFFDHLDQRKNVFGEIFSVEIEYDEKERPISAWLKNADGEISSSTFGYAKVGWVWENDREAVETRYDENGDPIKSGAEFPFSQAVFERDGSGFITRLTIADDDYSVAIKRRRSGVRRSWRAMDSEGPRRGGAAHVAGIDYDYDENGYLKRAVYLDERGEASLGLSGHMGFRRLYNEAGNRLGYDFVGASGNIWIPPDRGYAGQRFFWREDGVVRTRTEYVDEQGKLLDHPTRGYASVDHHFNSRNEEVRRVYRTAEGEVVNDESNIN